jgi:hypothetical protein
MTVTRSGHKSGALTVSYETKDGTAVAADDYQYQTGSLLFGDQEATKTFVVTVRDDHEFEYPNQQFYVRLTGVEYNSESRNSDYLDTLGHLARAPYISSENETCVLIADDDDTGQLSLVRATMNVTEGRDGSNLTLTITRVGHASGDLTAVWTTVNGTASDYPQVLNYSDSNPLYPNASTLPQLSDYVTTGGTIVFHDQERAKTLTVAINDDSIYEYPDEVFDVVLFNVRYLGLKLPTVTLGAISKTSVTIRDNGDAGTISFAGTYYEQREHMLNRTVTVTRSAPWHGNITVDYATVNGVALAGQDYDATQGTLVFGSGVKTQTVVVAITDDTVYEYPDETFQVVLSDVKYNDEAVYSVHLDEPLNATVKIIDDGDAGTFHFNETQYSVVKAMAIIRP